MQLTVIARSLTTGTEATREVTNASYLVTGARLAETTEGLPYLRIEPRVEKGLTITEGQASGEEYTTSKVGLKLQPVGVTANFYGFEYVQDTAAGKTHEWFLKPKLGSGMTFDATGALVASGGAGANTSPATRSTLGTVIIGNGLSVVTTAGATQGTIAVDPTTGLQIVGTQLGLKTASTTEIGGVRINGNGLSIAVDGTLSVTNGVSGGTANYIPLWSSATALTSSAMYQDSSNIGIGSTTPKGKLTVQGGALATTTSEYALHLSTALSAGRLATGAASKLAALHTWHDDSIVEISAGSTANYVTGILLGARSHTSATGVGDRITFWTRSTKRLEIDGTGASYFSGNVLFATDAQYDVGSSGASRPRDVYASGKLTLGTNPAPATGAGAASPLRVEGKPNTVGTYDAGYFTGTIYASDFVLLDGTGSVSSASPPISLYAATTFGGTQFLATSTLSTIRFTGSGVRVTSYTSGDITLDIAGGSSGVAMQSGSSTANALPKFFNASTSPTLANSRLSDDGTTIVLGGNTTVTGLLTTSSFKASSQVEASVLVAGGGVNDRLGIQGLTAGSGTLLNSTNAAANAYAPLTLDGSLTKFQVAGAQKMLLDASGNLGLGVTPSAWASDRRVLQIGGSVPSLSFSSAIAETYFNTVVDNALAIRYQNNGPAGLIDFNNRSSGGFSWNIAASGVAGNAISFTQAMTLDASGNLLLGLTSPNNAIFDAYSAANGIARIRGGSGTNQGGAFFVSNSAGTQTLAAFGDTARMLGGAPDAGVTVFAGNVPLSFYVNSATRATIDTSGNLGLGVTPRAWNSAYRAMNIGALGFVYSRTDNDGTSIGTNWFRDAGGAFRYAVNGFASEYLQISGVHSWLTAPSGTAGAAVTFTQAMTLDASGNLGVGTTGPLGRLHVSGADAVRIALINGGTRAVRIGADATAAYVEGVDQTGVGSYQPLYVGGSVVALFTGGTERARIDASGNLNVVAAITQNNNQVLHAGNFTSYSPGLTGTGASGSWGISITGNAATATQLQTARTINGTSFNGTSAITTANWGTARDITIGSTTRSVNGSTPYSWTLEDIGAAASTHSHAISDVTGLQTALDGKVATSRTLTINGTANQVTVTGGAQDLSANRTWTVSLPNSVAITTALDVGNIAGLSAATLRVGGDVRLSGTIYATDFVLTSGTGGTATAGPPIVVVDETTALNTTTTPLSQLTFTGTGVTASQTSSGQITVNIPGGSGVSMNSGSSTANALPKFFNAATTPTLANSRLSDDGNTITLGGNTTVSGSLTVGANTITAGAFSGSGASLTNIPISAVTSLQTALDGKAATSHTHAAADITSGVIAVARLGTGTANNTTYLRGDGTWATVAASGGTVTSVGGAGTVSGLTLSGSVTTSGNLTLGGTLAVTAANFASQTANTILAAPSGVAGTPTFRTLVSADLPTYTGTLTSAQVTTALGYTPYNSTNPSGYISSITSSMVTTALGYTPYSSTNPSGYISSITSSMVTTALGYTPYNTTNPSGYITAAQTVNIGTTSIALNRASAALTLSGVSLSTLTISTGLSGSSYNGGSNVTIAIDNTVTTLTGTQTLTNKTLTSPTINTATITAGSLAYKVGGVNYNTSDVNAGSGAAAGTPDGALWVVYS